MSNTETLGEGNFLRLLRRGRWEWVQRTRACGSVTIVAVTRDRKLLLVEQFRDALSRNVLELPAGIAGDQGVEPLEDAVHRELSEEAGYEAGSIRALGGGPCLPGLTCEVQSYFLATELTRVGPGGGDETEDIRVHEVPLDELRDWLAVQDALVCPQIFAALFLAEPFL